MSNLTFPPSKSVANLRETASSSERASFAASYWSLSSAILASVSCIYSLGDPQEYESLLISLRPGMEMSRDELIHRLVSISYERNDMNFVRDKFRVRGDVVEIYPASSTAERAIRV